jgi:succinylglutamate desuccinylase
MNNDIIELKGDLTGPTSMILVGVHGNERCGLEALEKLLPKLAIKNGRVLIGYGNPIAIEQNVRFTEMNLNRSFKDTGLYSKDERVSYEYQRAQFLKTYLDQADVLLDIHASTTPNSQPFIICENNALEIVKYLPFKLINSGFDKLHPGGTDGYMNNRGKIGICVECGYLGDSSSTQKAEESILAFLIARGHTDGLLEITKQSHINFDSIYFTKTNSFRLAKEFKDFEEIHAKQLIGIDGTEKIRAVESGIIIFAGNHNLIGSEAFVFGQYIKNPML